MTRSEVHLHDISARPVFISFFKAVRGNQRVSNTQRHRHFIAVAGAADDNPVPVDAEIDRPVHHCIDQNPTPFPSQSRGMLFRFCSGRKSVHPHSNSRVPQTRANSDAGSKPPGTHPASLTLQHGP